MRKTIFTLVAIMVIMFVSCGGGGSNDPVSNPDPVPNPEPVPVEPTVVKSMEVSPKLVTLHLGESTVLKAKMSPADAEHYFSWNAENHIFSPRNTLEDCDSFEIIGSMVGESPIIVREAITGLADTCHVIVRNDPVAIEKVSFESQKLELYEGQLGDILPKVYPYYATETFGLNSEDKEIVNVWSDDVGYRIQGVKPGTTTIVATTSEGKSVGKCNITVKDIDSAVLNVTKLVLDKGQTGTLQIDSLLPKGATCSNITWKSENEDVALLEKGESWYVSTQFRVRALRYGETDIVVTSCAGNVVAKCHVTVKNKNVNNIGFQPYGDDEQW